MTVVRPSANAVLSVPIAVLGGTGHLGGSVVAALVAASVPPELVLVTGRRTDRIEAMSARSGVRGAAGTAEACASASIVILVVPPQAATGVLAQVAHTEPDRSPGGRALVSFVAGLSIASLRATCAGFDVLVRASSNAAAIGPDGRVAVSVADGHTGRRLTLDAAERTAPGLGAVLGALGNVDAIDEEHQDVAAATLGSGAAFLAHAASALVDAATVHGVDATIARRFAGSALLAAERLLAAAPEGDAPWRPLATPGGITSAGIDALEARRSGEAMAHAVAAAVDRASHVHSADTGQGRRVQGWQPVPWIKRAFLVALEGPDGSGKTTAGLRLVESLTNAGHDVVWWPNRTMRPLRDALEALADSEGAADRFELLGRDQAQRISLVAKWRELLGLETVLARPEQIVVVDRYKYAHIALTQALDTENGPLARRLFGLLPNPDVVYYFDVDPVVAAERVRRRAVDSNTVEFLRDFTRGYRDLPEFPTFLRLPADRTADVVFTSMSADIGGRLPPTART